MAHKEQRDFCKRVKKLHPEYFKSVSAIDVGSYDICGNNRFLFDSLLNRNKYVGIDLFDGKNVDIVGRAHEILATHNFEGEIDVIVSTEALEHDATWKETLMAIYSKVKNGGMILLTAAGEGREEHGT